MYGQISTLAFIGIEARPVEVQVRVTPGAAAFAIVGLPDKAVAESRERVRNALHAVGLGLVVRPASARLPASRPQAGQHPSSTSRSISRLPIFPKKAATSICRSCWR